MSFAERWIGARRLAAALLVVMPGVSVSLSAHDPGLSSIDVVVGRDRVAATVMLATADVAGVLTGGEADRGRLIADALTLRVEGRRLQRTVHRLVPDTGNGLRVDLIYARSKGAQLTICSQIPRMLAKGHREFISVRAEEGDVLAERVLDTEADTIEVSLAPSGSRAFDRFRGFLVLGVEHILTGYDHLLFLAGLLFAGNRRADVLKIISAFTVAHSCTLAMATLGLARIPASIVEPLIALSIVYVAGENLLRRSCPRWPLVFAFGLIHGFSFAQALADGGVGAAATGALVPLFAFNLGVEAGQIGVALAALPLLRALERHTSAGPKLAPACSVLLALVGTYWFVERAF